MCLRLGTLIVLFERYALLRLGTCRNAAACLATCEMDARNQSIFSIVAAAATVLASRRKMQIKKLKNDTLRVPLAESGAPHTCTGRKNACTPSNRRQSSLAQKCATFCQFLYANYQFDITVLASVHQVSELSFREPWPHD